MIAPVLKGVSLMFPRSFVLGLENDIQGNIKGKDLHGVMKCGRKCRYLGHKLNKNANILKLI